MYTLFTGDVKLKHVYEWNLGHPVGRDPGPEDSREGLAPYKARANTTGYPWTTASALVMNDGKPLSEGMMKYTSKGGTAELRLTVATDIKTDKSELEIERKRT